MIPSDHIDKLEPGMPGLNIFTNQKGKLISPIFTHIQNWRDTWEME